MKSRPVTSLLLAVLAMAGASCSDDGSITKDDASAPTSSVSATTTSSAGGGSDFSSELPKSAVYGDLTWTVTGVRTSANIDTSNAPDGSEYAAVDLEVTSELKEIDYSYSYEVVSLELDDESIEPVSYLSDNIEAPGQQTTPATVVYEVPAGSDLSDAGVVIQEAAGSADEARIPARIPFGAEPATVAGERIPLDGQFVSTDAYGSLCEPAYRFAFTSADLRDDLGQTERGQNVGSVQGMRNGDYDGRRALDGQKFLVVEVTGVNIATFGGACQSSKINWDARVVQNGTPIAEVLRIECEADEFTTVPTPCDAVFMVPEAFETGTVEFDSVTTLTGRSRDRGWCRRRGPDRRGRWRGDGRCG